MFGAIGKTKFRFFGFSTLQDLSIKFQGMLQIPYNQISKNFYERMMIKPQLSKQFQVG